MNQKKALNGDDLAKVKIQNVKELYKAHLNRHINKPKRKRQIVEPKPIEGEKLKRKRQIVEPTSEYIQYPQLTIGIH